TTRQFVLETDGVHDETTADFFNGIGPSRTFPVGTVTSAPGGRPEASRPGGKRTGFDLNRTFVRTAVILGLQSFSQRMLVR
ncbi:MULTISPECIES: hypothetical protein, partial [unclassified Bradyrhizobium]